MTGIMTMDEATSPLVLDSDLSNSVDSTVRRTDVRLDEAEAISSGSEPTTISRQLVDKTLHFLSHASNETLGACLLGLGASTYLVLGRVGLVLIGVAGGVILHATWEGPHLVDEGARIESEKRVRRGETGLHLAQRLLDWRSAQDAREDLQDDRVLVDKGLNFSAFQPKTRSALESFTTAVIQDYVYYWYGPTLPGEESFPASCKSSLTAYILSLSGHLQRKRPADVFLDFVTNASSIIIVFLNELAAATNASPQSPSEEAIATYLKLKPESSLSYVLDEKSQLQKLAEISEDILQAYLDPKSYNCIPVHTLLKEVLAQLVLGYTVTLCSRPEWINEWIVYGLEESETASKVMDIVDAGVEGRDAAAVSTENHQDKYSTPVVKSRKEALVSSHNHSAEQHRRQMSRAEEAMDEAMQEAKRLTQLMIEEDEQRTRQELEKTTSAISSEAISVVGDTQGAATQTSSNGDIALKQRDEQSKIDASPDDGVPSEDRDPSISSQSITFDQLTAPSEPASLLTGFTERVHSPLTLHNANISIFDDSQPGERTSIKAKPTTDYLIQIEPNNSAYPGWMISRKFGDFEMLHEVLRRISVITGVTGFAESHKTLPLWKGNTKAALRNELEQYLVDAVRFQPLAESEGMKRFLERDRGLNKSPTGKGFGWPTPDGFGRLGGDMVSVLTKAPKHVADGVAGGGKVVLGGMAGLVGGKKSAPYQSASTTALPGASSSSLGSGSPTTTPSIGEAHAPSSDGIRQSQDSFGSHADLRPAFSRTVSTDGPTFADSKPSSATAQPIVDQRLSDEALHDAPMNSAPDSSFPPSNGQPPLPTEEEILDLPPPPSERPADYSSPGKPSCGGVDVTRSATLSEGSAPPETPSRTSNAKPKAPLTERETSVAVELMFAVVSELYTLSSAWNFRRTLLTAAKTFLLRPGNPQLAAIRDLLQNSLLDANLSDAGLAAHILKLRENALPTPEELKMWERDYPEKTPEQKDALRVKARKLLVTKGMPQALTSVMGAAASGEALGKVFDCLQVESVSRGLVFGLMLQALRVVTH